MPEEKSSPGQGHIAKKARTIGGVRFKHWVHSENRLQTVFAHSYGGEIVARAVNSGASIEEVVLLSAPMNHHHEAMVNLVDRVIDVRLKYDIVLLAARSKQKLSPANNVTTFIIPKSIGATAQHMIPRHGLRKI